MVTATPRIFEKVLQIVPADSYGYQRRTTEIRHIRVYDNGVTKTITDYTTVDGYPFGGRQTPVSIYLAPEGPMTIAELLAHGYQESTEWESAIAKLLQD